MYVCIHVCNVWMYGCMDGWMYGCMDHYFRKPPFVGSFFLTNINEAIILRTRLWLLRPQFVWIFRSFVLKHVSTALREYVKGSWNKTTRIEREWQRIFIDFPNVPGIHVTCWPLSSIAIFSWSRNQKSWDRRKRAVFCNLIWEDVIFRETLEPGNPNIWLINPWCSLGCSHILTTRWTLESENTGRFPHQNPVP